MYVYDRQQQCLLASEGHHFKGRREHESKRVDPDIYSSGGTTTRGLKVIVKGHSQTPDRDVPVPFLSADCCSEDAVSWISSGM